MSEQDHDLGDGTAFALGALTAQVRELIHQNNNRAMADKALSSRFAEMTSLPEDIADIKKEVRAIGKRMDALERKEAEMDARKGVWTAILNSKPVSATLGLLTAAAMALAGWFMGRGGGT